MLIPSKYMYDNRAHVYM